MSLPDTGIDRRVTRAALFLVAALTLQACDDGPTGEFLERTIPTDCSILTSEIFSGALKDAIPALTDPQMDFPGASGNHLWQDDDRIVGIVVNGQAVAVPLNIFWHHEIVNLNLGGTAVAVTHCPLTGSSLAFDRSAFGDVEFGVSGLLYRNNLIMYDRSGGVDSFWPQMIRGARCGPQDGAALPMLPVIEVDFRGWRTLHPNTQVVTPNTGHDRDYATESNPYGDYGDVDNEQLLYPWPIDRSRPPKERVLGVPDGEGGMAFPYGSMREVGLRAAMHETIGSQDMVILWDDFIDMAMAYYPFADGQDLTFSIDAFNQIVDNQTGSIWNAGGEAVQGPLLGMLLEPVNEAFVAYWFAWPAFYSNIQLWSAP